MARIIDRPTEEVAITLSARRAALKHNLSKLNDDFERLLVLLLAIGFRRKEIAEFEVGIGRARVSQIINRGMKRFEEVER